MAFGTSDAITVTDVRNRVHDLVEENLTIRRAFMQMNAPATTDNQWSIPIDSDVLGEPGEVPEGSNYPTDEEGFSTVTATRRKFGQTIPITDEAEMDNVFELAGYLTNKMARKMNEKLDSEAFTILDGNFNDAGAQGDDGGTLTYDEVLSGVETLGLDGYDPDLLILDPSAEADLRTDADFTRDTQMGDAVVSEGRIDRVAGMDVVVSNTGDVAQHDAYLVDTDFYGAEVVWTPMEAEEVEDRLKDTTYLKARTFRDWVALDAEAAIKVQG